VPRLVPTPVFHITAIANLGSIARAGLLLSKTRTLSSGVKPADIAYQTVQGHRSVKQVPTPPGGTLHDYVPFYFAPRSPMLKTIDSGNVPNCTYRQDDIVHLTTTVEAVGAASLPFVFTNYHAVKAFAEFFSAVADLDKIDWDLFFESPRIDGYCKFWHNPHSKPRYVRRMETRQAEFLVHGAIPLAAIAQIGVRTENMAGQVNGALQGTGWNPEVRIVPGWYF